MRLPLSATLLVLLLTAWHPRFAFAGSKSASPTAWNNPRDDLTYVRVPPGQFQMGCTEDQGECTFLEQPAHTVRITRGFWIGKTEVPVWAYRRFADESDSGMPPDNPFNPEWKAVTLPIVNVNWHQAEAFCNWAGGRLPTEAEWEYAARGGAASLPYPWGRSLDHGQARYSLLPDERDRPSLVVSDFATTPVGSHPPNGFGLQDAVGNVEEWCADVFDPLYYRHSPESDPIGPAPLTSLTPRALRGGSWMSASPQLLRLSYRRGEPPDQIGPTRGFRCVIH